MKILQSIPRVFVTLYLFVFLPLNFTYSQDFVDLMITGIIFEDPCDHDQQIGVEIVNDGTLAGSDIPITLEMNGEVIFEEVIAGPIQPAEVIVYNFSGTVAITVEHYSQDYNFSALVIVPGDPSPENNGFGMNMNFYDPAYIDRDGWTTYTPCNSGLTNMFLSAVVEYGDTIFASTGGGGIMKYENDTWSSFTVESGDLLHNNIECMVLPGDGNIWIGYWDYHGASWYDGSSWTHYTPDDSGIVPGSIEKILLDAGGNYWFGSHDEGVSVLDGVDWTTYNTENSSLPDNRVWDIIEDQYGRIWIGTDNGVVRITGGVWEVLTTENSGLSANRIMDIFEDSQGNLWFGASNGTGLSMFDGTDWHAYTPWNSGLHQGWISNINEDSRGNLWFGTSYGGYSVLMEDRWVIYNTSNALVHDGSWGEVMEDSNGDIWIPTYNGLMKRSPDALDYLSTFMQRPTCSGDSDGRIIIDAIAASWPIYYSIDGGNTFQTDSVFENLTYQPYDIAISDGTTTQQCETVWTEPYHEIADFPVMEDFEEFWDSPWYQAGGTAEWIIHSGSTPSNTTGPEGDHTSGDGYYIYVEASSDFLEWANLYSPCYHTGNLVLPKLEFVFHLYGSTMGDLYLDIMSDGVWINDVMEFHGDYGPEWNLGELDLSPYGDVIKLRFRAQVGDGYSSDIAIDDVHIFNDFSAMETHFNTIWSGNGVDHMNFYALTASIDDVPMQVYDEIAVYDGDHCVGTGILTEVLEDGVNYLAFVASNNDAEPPEVNGYTEGNPITFRVWDYSEQKEYDRIEIDYVAGEDIYTIAEYVSFHLYASTAVDQVRDLAEGWNIYSYYVTPETMDMHALIQPLIDEGSLLKVQDETGGAIENVSPIGWIFNINDMANTEGYKIKVSYNTSLVTTGFVVPLPYEIPLQEGWNIMGLPSESQADAQNAFSTLISGGILSKVQNERGDAIEYVVPIGWIYNINDLIPGEGYKVKVNENTALEINEGGMKSDRIPTPAPAAKHYSTVWEGNGLDHMNIYITEATLDGMPLESGYEIGIFSEGLCVGAGNVANPQVIALKASLDDPTTPEIDGYSVGTPIELRLWNPSSNVEYSISEMEVVHGYPGTFERMGTSSMKVDFDPGTVLQTSFYGIFPNPVTNEASIRFVLGKSGKVLVETYNLLGKKTALSIRSTMNKGANEITWQPFDEKGNRLSAGTYILKLVAGDFVGVRRIVVL